ELRGGDARSQLSDSRSHSPGPGATASGPAGRAATGLPGTRPDRPTYDDPADGPRRSAHRAAAVLKELSMDGQRRQLHTRDYLRRLGVPEPVPATTPFDPGYDPV